MSVRQKSILLTVVTVALGVFFAVWLCPYMKLYGHERMCIGFYIVLVFAYFYLRPSAPRVRRNGGGRRAATPR